MRENEKRLTLALDGVTYKRLRLFAVEADRSHQDICEQAVKEYLARADLRAAQQWAMIETPTEILSHHADAVACDSFIAWRKRIKKPLTERAALMIAKTLSAINAGGGDATEALDLAQEHGWASIKPEWYWRQKNGNGHSTAGNPSADTADRSIAFAAGFARTPGRDCF